MSLAVERFEEFLAALHGQGRSPYRWQTHLLERLLSRGRWPQEMDIPTGGGKSTVIEIHVFANAVAQQRWEAGEKDAPRIPRRLSMIVPRRAVVDDHLKRATMLMDALTQAEEGILAEVRELLVRRSYPADVPAAERKPLRVHLLRGGSAAIGENGSLGRRRDEWIHHPAAVQILCGTPDMIGSRLLHRGYGVAPRARPRSAGLLSYDHIAILDEAHLSRQLLNTFRRVSDMCRRWNPATAEVPALQVCAATATHAVSGDADAESPSAPDEGPLTLDWEQLEPSLTRILTLPKPVEYLELENWNAETKKALEAHAALILKQVGTLREEVTGPIGVVVNRVKTAVQIQEMAHRSDLRTQLLVGPQRVGEPRDLHLEDADLVVATQTIEVGVDVDFAAMVTDLAPGSALVQRVGRVNRRGEREHGRVIVIGPKDTDSALSTAARPYETEDIRQAREWIRQLARDPEGLSPLNLRRRNLPPTAPSRPVFSHLDDADVRMLTRTSEQMFADPDLTFWLRDSLDSDEQEVRVIGRTLPTLSPDLTSAQRAETVDAAYQLLQQLTYEDQEVYPSTPARVREVLTQKNLDSAYQAWVHRNDEWTLLRPHAEEGLPHSAPANSFPLRGGDLVVLNAEFPCTLGISADDSPRAQGSGAVFLPEGSRPIGDHSHPETLGVHTYIHQPPAQAEDSESLDTLICRAAGEAEPGEDGALLIEDLPIDGLPLDPHALYDVRVGPPTDATDGEPAWVICTVRQENVQEEQLDLPTAKPVLLENHQKDVAERVSALADLLALPAMIKKALHDAGLNHDRGKEVPAFQAMLRLKGTRPHRDLSASSRKSPQEEQREGPYAKSTGLLPASRRQENPVPPGWRHEMISVAKYWEDNAQGRSLLPETAGQTELATWLIGTHHGLGRSSFPLGTDRLLSVLSEEEGSAVVQNVLAFYGSGLWEDLAALMERTYGPWATSYLEALLRAADVTISQEGR